MSRQAGRLAAGEHHFRLPGRLSAGVYLIRLEYDDAIATIRAVATR